MHRTCPLLGVKRTLIILTPRAHIGKMLNNTLNNPIVLVIALAMLAVAYGIYLIAF